MIPAYSTKSGTYYLGNSTSIEKTSLWEDIEEKVDLIFTSPPFALARKKKYGNLNGEEYVNWIGDLAPIFNKMLKPTGSIVIEMGNVWEKGIPVMSTIPLQSLLFFLEKGEFNLCQQFIWNNPARLPSPAQWVNIERIRVKDSFTHIWWMANHKKPKANNRNVLKEYSQAMLDLLERGSYNSGNRPSEHQIGEDSFLTNNSGAIPSNVFTVANTRSSSPYLDYCSKNNYKKHPARMPKEIIEFFINFLTEPGDLILDPFAGSNTTGYVAENLNRNWISIDKEIKYILGSRGRFNSFTNLKAINDTENV